MNNPPTPEEFRSLQLEVNRIYNEAVHRRDRMLTPTEIERVVEIRDLCQSHGLELFPIPPPQPD